MNGMMEGMHWMMWGGLAIWLLVIVGLIWAVALLVKHQRSNQAK